VTPKEIKGEVMHLMAGNMSCQELTELITEYLEGTMPMVQRIRFQIHLGLCLGCRNHLHQMKLTIQTLGKLPVEPMPPAIRAEMLHRFRNWKKE